MRSLVLTPLCWGTFGGFGVSLGYALYDITALTVRNWAIIKVLTGAGSAITGATGGDSR